MAAIVSVLEEAIDQIIKATGGKAIKKQTLIPALKKRGVKDDELKWSGFQDFVEKHPSDKISFEELQKVKGHSSTQFYESQVEQPRYQRVLPKGASVTNYRETVKTAATTDYPLEKQAYAVQNAATDEAALHEFVSTGYPKSLEYTSPHWGEGEGIMEDFKGNIWHTRTYDEAKPVEWEESPNHKAYEKALVNAADETGLDFITLRNFVQGRNGYGHLGVSARKYITEAKNLWEARNEGGEVGDRVIAEIQSDLHQEGRQYGYKGEASKLQKMKAEDLMSEMYDYYDTGMLHPELSKLVDEELEYRRLMYDADEAGDDKAYTMYEAKANEAYDKIATAIDQTPEFLFVGERRIADGRVPNAPFKEDWWQKAINEEVVKAAKEGKSRVKIAISPPGKEGLHRAEGVQRWYESSVNDYYKKLAKKIGGEYSYEDGYGVIKLPDKPFKLPLYSVAGGALMLQEKDSMAGTMYEDAKAEGYTDDEILNHLKSSEKYQEALNEGYSEQEILSYYGVPTEGDLIFKREYPTTPEGYLDVREQLPLDLVRPRDVKATAPVSRIAGTPEYELAQKQMAVMEDADTKVSKTVAQADSLRANLIQLAMDAWDGKVNENQMKTLMLAGETLKAEGVIDDMVQDPTDGKIYYVKNGQTRPMESSLWDSISASKMEALGSVLGAVALTETGPAGMVAGGAAGAASGRAYDMGEAAKRFGIELTPGDVAKGMFLAGAQDAVIGVAGAAVIGTASKVSGKIRNIGQILADDNLPEAYAKTLELTGKSNDEAVQLTKDYLREFAEGPAIIAQGETSKDFRRATIEALMLTDPKMISMVKAGTKDLTANTNLATQVEARALQAKKLAEDSMTNGQDVIKNLENFRQVSGELYGNMRGAFNNVFQGRTVNMDPVIERASKVDRYLTEDLISSFTDAEQRVVYRFRSKLNQIEPGQADIEDLLDVRQAYNELYSVLKKSVKKPAKDALRGIKLSIDDSISSEINKLDTLSGSEKKKLKLLFQKSREFYSVGAQLDTNKLVSTLTTPGKNSEKVLDDLYKFADANAKEYDHVMSLLSKDERAQAEQAVLGRVIQKNLRTTSADFKSIVTQMERVSGKMETDEARQMVARFNQMDKLFGQDPVFESITKNVSLESASAGISPTTNPIEFIQHRTAYTGLSRFWERAQLVLPGLLNELSFGLAGKTPGVKAWVRTAKELAIQRNIEDALLNAKTPVEFLQRTTEIPGMKSSYISGVKEFVKHYEQYAEELNRIDPAVRGKYVKQWKTPQLPAESSVPQTQTPSKPDFYAGKTGIDPNLMAVIKSDKERAMVQHLADSTQDPQVLQAFTRQLLKAYEHAAKTGDTEQVSTLLRQWRKRQRGIK